jgi:hypothetical protein
MNTLWIIGTLIAIGFFAVVESYAFKHPERQNTLSMAIYTIGSKWPLSIWLMGVFCGALATHFFWHFCPPGSISTGAFEVLRAVLGG